MTIYEHTPRNQVKRHPERGAYDAATIYPIVDAALICHVGFVLDGQPFVIPTLHARQGDTILLHGSRTSRLLQHAQAGGELCITVTLLDGIVLARAVFSHSINYRSAVLFGQGQPIEDADAQMAALEAFTEKLIPGRWNDARLPSPTEMRQTAIVAVPIASASANNSPSSRAASRSSADRLPRELPASPPTRRAIMPGCALRRRQPVTMRSMLCIAPWPSLPAQTMTA